MGLMNRMHFFRELPLREVARKVGWRLQLQWRRLCWSDVLTKQTTPEGRLVPRAFLCEPGQVATIAERARSACPAAVKHVCAVADEVVAGRVSLFRLGAIEVNPQPAVWQNQADETHWRLLGRHDFLVFLALAFAYTQQVKYRRTLLGYLRSWFNGRGDRSDEKSIDAANRLVNWAWLRQIPGLLEEELWPSWIQSVRSDAVHVQRLLSVGGNHLALDGLGLWAAGVSNPKIPEAVRWRRRGARIMKRVARHQYTCEGFHRERSMSYHLLVTRLLLDFACSAKRRSDVSEIDPVMETVRRASEAAVHLQWPDGSYPLLSDSDAFCEHEVDHLRNRMVLEAGAQLFDAPARSLRDSDGPGDDLAYWYFSSVQSEKTRPDCRPNETPTCTVLEQAGYAALRTGWGRNASMAVMDAGPFGMEAFPHHGHADALNLLLYLNGHPLLVDPGGYAYRDDALRYWVRSTAAHNTIRVGATNQSELEGVTGVGYRARAQCLSYDCSPPGMRVRGKVWHHRGHPAHPVHTRSAMLAEAEQTACLVLDVVEGEPGSLLELYWHLHPTVEAQRHDEGWSLEAGSRRWLLMTDASVAFEWERKRGKEGGEPAGWYIPNALDRQPATTLCLQGRIGPEGRTVVGTGFVRDPAQTGDGPKGKASRVRLTGAEPAGVVLEGPAERLVLTPATSTSS